MKKFYYYGLMLGFVFGSLVFTACGDDDENEDGPQQEQPQRPDQPDQPDQPGGDDNNLTFSVLKFEKLPDMNVARRGHALIATANGDVVAVGGHTTGFQLTKTAERLNGDKWESVGINNPHDGAANIALPDGRVLICGGMGSALGIGQIAACDIYDPAAHSFSPTGSMKTARAFCAGVPTGDGNTVLLSGNWYSSDTTFELWDGSAWTAFGKKDVQLNNPLVANAGNGIVYVFGCRSNYGQLQKVVVWKVNTKDKTAEKVENTGLEDYELYHGDYFNSLTTVDGSYICLGAKEKVIHLLRFDTKTAKATSIATLPDAIPDVTNDIQYSSGILLNPSRNEAYIIGAYQAKQGKALIVINYNLEKRKMTVYHGGQFDGFLHWGAWALKSDGKIVVTGGSVKDNYDPIKSAIVVTPF